MLGGRGERLDGIETDLAQVGFGLLPDEVIGVAQGLDQAVDLLRRWRRGGGRLRGGKNLRRGNDRSSSRTSSHAERNGTTRGLRAA